jgi:hypothetical protein
MACAVMRRMTTEVPMAAAGRATASLANTGNPQQALTEPVLGKLQVKLNRARNLKVSPFPTLRLEPLFEESGPAHSLQSRKCGSRDCQWVLGHRVPFQCTGMSVWSI